MISIPLLIRVASPADGCGVFPGQPAGLVPVTGGQRVGQPLQQPPDLPTSLWGRVWEYFSAAALADFYICTLSRGCYIVYLC